MGRKVASADFLSEEGQHFYKAINEENDLGCILLASSYLDQCVGALLQGFLIEGDTSKKVLDYKSGIIGSFAARVDLAYCLGLIGQRDVFQSPSHFGDSEHSCS